VPQIETSRTLDIARPAVAQAILQICKEAEQKKAPYDNVSLRVNFEQLHLPGVGTVDVPIVVTVANAIGIPPTRFDLTITAQNNEAYFPRFEGTVFPDGDGPTKTDVWLRGEYTPPLGTIGKALDAAMFSGAARTSLESFLLWLVTEAATRIRHDEYETARATLHRHE